MNSQNQLPLEIATLRDLRLLIVESESADLATMTSALQACGAQVIAVDSAKAGLEAVEQQRPDVMVSNLHLCDGDGYTLMNQVKNLILRQSMQQVPAIAVSNSAREVDVDRAISAGFKRYVSKPIRPARLVELVARLSEREFVRE